MPIKLLDKLKRREFRFYIAKNNKPVHPAFDLTEARYNRQKDGSWKHKETNLPFKVKGKIYKGEPGNYAYDDKEFLDFLKTQDDVGNFGFIMTVNKEDAKKIAKEIGLKRLEDAKYDSAYDSVIKNVEVEIVSGTEVKNLPIKDVEWIVKDLVAEGGIILIGGKSGAYKSLTLLYLAHCIALCIKVFNKYLVKQKTVLYINEENTWSIFKPMVRNIQRGFKKTNFKNIYFCTYQNLSLDMNDDLGRAKLEKAIRETKAEVVIFDSLKRFINFDENDANRVNEFYTHVLKPLQIKYKITIILIHHTRKETTNMRYRVDKKDMIRGSSDFVNIADVILYFEKTPRPLLFNIHQPKCRMAEEFETKTIKIIADKKCGFTFEELTTEAESEKEILQNSIRKDITDFIFKRGDGEFKSGDDAWRANFSKYKRTNFYSAVASLVIDGVLIKSGRGKYKVKCDHIIFQEMKKEANEKELQLKLNSEEQENES